MNAVSKTKSKSKRWPKPKPKPSRHRDPDPRHPRDIDIDLHSNRADLKDLLLALNPILAEVVKRLKKNPLGEGEACAAPPGYHNITLCEH
jgi:hypothetical protein